MKTPLMIVIAMAVATPGFSPSFAQAKDEPVVWQTGNKQYNTIADCRRAKKRAKDRSTVAGAAIAGAGAALLGGSFAETALVAGAGALAGREIGKRTVKQC
jgi:outer membrane lipoprotein SlyB